MNEPSIPEHPNHPYGQAPSASGWPTQPGNSPVPYGQPHAPQPYAQQPFPYGYPPGYGHGQPPAAPPVSPSGLYTAAAIVNWVTLGAITLVTCGLGLIAAAWIIPMTIQIHKGAKDRRKHVALAVCTLLFCNVISGILMLVDEGNRTEHTY